MIFIYFKHILFFEAIMKKCKFSLFPLFFIFLFSLHTPQLSAKLSVPDPLKEWVPWVLHNQEEQGCTTSYSGKQKYCVWPELLQMNLSSTGGSFKQTWLMEKKGWVILPGNEKNWPQEVMIDSKSALVVNKTGKPAIYIDSPGSYLIRGYACSRAFYG
jgi:hypothetical protein